MQSIAVLIASTSNNSGWESVDDVFFLNDTIPSILSKKSDRIKYKFFLGFDDDDDFLLNHKEEIESRLKSFEIDFSLLFVENELHKPCPVWNHLFEIAYEEEFDFFLQTGDDIHFYDAFDEDFILYLKSFDNFGVVGGISRTGPQIITQAFVHRNHMDVFGFLFPPELPDWGSDNWINVIYYQYDKARLSSSHRVVNNKIVDSFRDNHRYVVSDGYRDRLNLSLKKYNPALKEALFQINNKSDRA